jgi:hypothetical protein
MKGFQLGKYYQHHSGEQLYICAKAPTKMYGICFIGERGHNKELLKNKQRIWDECTGEKSNIRPGNDGWVDRLTGIDITPEAAENWFEITEDNFMENNFC